MASRESPDDFPDLDDETLDRLSTYSEEDKARVQAETPARVRQYTDAEPVDDTEGGNG